MSLQLRSLENMRKLWIMREMFIRAEKLLEFVREVVTEYAVRQILHNGIASELSPLTRFYLLWRWTFGEARVKFNKALCVVSMVVSHLDFCESSELTGSPCLIQLTQNQIQKLFWSFFTSLVNCSNSLVVV